MSVRKRVIFFGSVLGALVGASAAYLYLKSTPLEVDEEGNEHLPRIQPGEALTVGLGVVTLLRKIIGLGQAES